MQTTFRLFSLKGDALMFALSKAEELGDESPDVDLPGVGVPYKSAGDLWCVVYPDLAGLHTSDLNATAS